MRPLIDEIARPLLKHNISLLLAELKKLLDLALGINFRLFSLGAFLKQAGVAQRTEFARRGKILHFIHAAAVAKLRTHNWSRRLIERFCNAVLELDFALH